MYPRSILTMANALLLAGMLLVHTPGLAQSSVLEAGQPGTQRICSMTKDGAPALSPEYNLVDAQPEDGQAVDSAQVQRPQTELATFGMGCFWGAEAVFCALDGVVSTTVGYTGGRTSNPGYRQVLSGMTGHAEAVQIRYDPSQISYESLLNAFWTHHDPTTINRQGPDVGTQYRSMIVFHSPEQQSVALESRRHYAAAFRNPIVTGIVPATVFYPAEDYHQDYLERRGRVRCRH